MKTLIAVAFLVFPLILAAPTSADSLINTEFNGDDNPVLVGEIVNAVNEVAIEYPEVRGTTVTAKPLDFAYATAFEHTISFNDSYLSSPETFQQMVERDVRNGFHPPLGRCSAVQYLAYHETAHVIHRSRDDKAIEEAVTRWFGDGLLLRGFLAEYSFNMNGSINPAEAMAEAFASVRCNGGNLAEWELRKILLGK